jgi:hypothetical protein
VEIAVSVVDSFCGCTACNTGIRSSSTFSTSIPVDVRSWPMTSPAASADGDGLAGTWRST